MTSGSSEQDKESLRAETRLHNSSVMATREVFGESGSFDFLNALSPFPQSFQGVVTNELDEGRSGAKVNYQKPPFSVDLESITTVLPAKHGWDSTSSSIYSYMVKYQNPGEVSKADRHTRLTDIEYDLLTGWKERGVNIPRVRKTRPGLLRLRKAKGERLDKFVEDLIRHVSLESISAEEGDRLFFRAYENALDAAITCDLSTGEILTDSQKQFLRRHDLKRFNGIRKNLPNLVASAYGGFFDREFFDLFRPLEREIGKATKKYGMWIADVYPKNVFSDAKGNISLVDGNHPEFGLMQISDTLLLDAYVPIREGFMGVNRYSTPFSDLEGQDERVKWALLKAKVKKWNEKSPRKINDFDDYMRGYYLARTFKSLRLAGRAITDLKQMFQAEQDAYAGMGTLTYQDIYRKVQESRHYFENAGIALDILESRFGIKTQELKKYVLTRGKEYLRSFVREQDWQDTMDFMFDRLDNLTNRHRLLPVSYTIVDNSLSRKTISV
jgi:hypothetical protein